MSQTGRIVRTLNFRKIKLQLFKGKLDRTPWETILKDKGAEERWQIFKGDFQRGQDILIPKRKKSGKEGKRSS